MARRPMLIAERLQRLEQSLSDISDEVQELRQFCLDISPEYSTRIITTMQEMEKKVFLNVTNFESRLGEINQTVKQLVAQSANDCLALVQSALGSKMAGLDSRMIGLNKRHVEIDKELSSTLQRLNEFSDSVERTMDNATHKAFEQMQLLLQERVATLVKTELLLKSLEEQENRTPFSNEGLPREQNNLCHRCNISMGTSSRGRARESFKLKQDSLMERARSVSSERELKSLIKEAKLVAAVDRVQEDD